MLFFAWDGQVSVRLHFGNSLVFSGAAEKAAARRNQIHILHFQEQGETPSASDALTEAMGHIAAASLNLLLLSLKDLIQLNDLPISLSDFGYIAF